MNYNKFSEKFYQKNMLSLNKTGFERTLKSFHLVDMYPSLKIMDKFSDTKELISFIKKHNQIENVASIYIHFPFCKNFCSYCHLYKENYFKQRYLETNYIDALKKEMKIYTEMFNKKIKAKSIYFGGGTPSLINTNNLSKLLNNLRFFFDISSETFISFEFYPEISFDKHGFLDKLKLLKSFGAQEVVLDIQSTNPMSLREVGRGNTNFFTWKKMIEIIKKVDIPRIKTSLIIGLPFDTKETFSKSVFDIANTRELSTVSLFLMEFRKGLRIYNELNINPFKFCSARERDEMQIMARKILIDKGFYESPIHFFNRRKYKKCRVKKKTLIETDKYHLLGIGPSAYGHIVLKDWSIKYYNYADINKYVHKTNKIELPISRWHKLNKNEISLSKLINDISYEGVVNIKDKTFKKYNYKIDKKFKNILKGLEKLKMVELVDDKIIVTELGKLRIEEMLWYLYDKKYKILERKFCEDKEVAMHNYVTIVSRKNEKLFDNFIKST